VKARISILRLETLILIPKAATVSLVGLSISPSISTIPIQNSLHPVLEENIIPLPKNDIEEVDGILTNCINPNCNHDYKVIKA
jgi:hypothetical protein